MSFYRFHICDPIKRVDGHGHDGASLDDDVDATLFAAGIIRRLIQEHRSIPRHWSIRIMKDGKRVASLSFADGCKFLLTPPPWESPALETAYEHLFEA